MGLRGLEKQHQGDCSELFHWKPLAVEAHSGAGIAILSFTAFPLRRWLKIKAANSYQTPEATDFLTLNLRGIAVQCFLLSIKMLPFRLA